MNDKKYTAINAMVDIVAAPGKALDHIRDHTSWLWYPLLTSIILASLAFIYYYQWVDMDWLIEQRIDQLPPEAGPEAAEGMRAFSGRGLNTGITVVMITIMTFLIYAIQAAYLHLATKVATESNLSYGQWFSFSAWTAFVGVFGTLAMLAVIFMAGNNQVAEADLNPLSINSLVIGASPGDPWFTWGNSLSVVNLWMLVLMSIGVSRWTGSSMVKSTIIAVLPWALIFGIWAAMI